MRRERQTASNSPGPEKYSKGSTGARKARAVGFNHVALEVGDIDEALAFYGRLFDFELRGRGERSAFIDLGDQFIALQQGRRQGPDDGRHFGLVVDDKEAVRAALAEAGIEPLPGRFLDFLDPWGNRIEIVGYANIQFTKAPHVLRGMGLGGLDKSEDRDNRDQIRKEQAVRNERHSVAANVPLNALEHSEVECLIAQCILGTLSVNLRWQGSSRGSHDVNALSSRGQLRVVPVFLIGSPYILYSSQSVTCQLANAQDLRSRINMTLEPLPILTQTADRSHNDSLLTVPP
jgi:lactoylglutathione lyase